MKERDIFQKYRKQKFRFSLKTRMVIGIGIIIFLSIIITFGIASLLERIWPFSTSIPLLIQINLFSLLISLVATHFFSKIFLDPIMELRKGMQNIADGKFGTRLETHSTSAEIQELYAGFNMMAEELGSTEILQSDFVSNVSHEFKTPISAIEGYTMLLQSTDNIDEVENEYIEKILFNQSIPTHQERYSLDEQIREAILAYEYMWEPKNIEFDVDLDTVIYQGNKNMMHHVWGNLLSNAIKFSPDGGSIKMRLYKRDSKILFTIEDQGPGLSDEAKKHLFDKFYQADTSHKEEGNGLGLALVNNIITLCGGEIYAENIDDRGCKFTVILPC